MTYASQGDFAFDAGNLLAVGIGPLVGFSPTGRTFVIATAAEIVIFGR